MKKLSLIFALSIFSLLFEQFLDNPPGNAVLYPEMSPDEITARTDSLTNNYYSKASEKVDRLFEKRFYGRRPGASVMVIQNGVVLHKNAYGYAQIRSRERIKTDTKFNLASISKQFTSMAVMMLKEDGRLSYDDKITKYFDNLPQRWNSITIKNLLTHTSGIPDRFYVIGYAEGWENKDILNRLVKNNVLDFTPGRRFKYSNSGYNLLSMIIEKISGMSYREFLEKRVFDPLGMNDTVVYDETKPDMDNRAVAYARTKRGYRSNDFKLTTTGSSGIFSSTEDLYKWDQALYTEKLVSKSSINEAFYPHQHSWRREYYGYGWRIRQQNDIKAVYHTGTLGGSSNIFLRIPEENFSIMILSNSGYRSRYQLVRSILEIYMPDVSENLQF
ncbi:MAG: beta-lactamase family protein [bacterium]|nr:beta-lactamase family protein [bacterium]